VCVNRARVRRDVLEKALLAGLQAQVLREEVVHYIIDRFEKELERELDAIGGEMDQMRKRKTKLESEIQRLAAGLASGAHSPAVMGEITKRERELSEISNRLLSSKPSSIRSRIAAVRENAIRRLRDLRQYLSGDVPTARAYLTKHVEEIVMDPEAGIYVASGSWNLLGSRYDAGCISDAGMVPGGRVELPTPAFSGPRSTGELPRHRRSYKL
jgi:hypothetical protein